MDERITGNDSDVALGATLRHANVVLADRVVEADVALAGGLIVEQARSGAPEIDLGGDYLIAGLIDLHTDKYRASFPPAARRALALGDGGRDGARLADAGQRHHHGARFPVDRRL